MAEILSKNKQYNGYNTRYKHQSKILGCSMTFSVFTPPMQAAPAPVLFYLSGLTCDDQNFITKANAQRKAAELGIVLVAPDTSPRGLNIEGDSASWDFGVGAGFYVNATVEKWKSYQMYSYINEELPALLSSFESLDLSRSSICGHSMGGHGALVIGLRNATKFKSISAFSPICHPSSQACPWGQKAFAGYLGSGNTEIWKEYDATELIKKHQGPKLPILIDQGSSDNFLPTQLMPDSLAHAAKEAGHPLEYRLQEGYDHSYFFISSFIDDHLQFHAKHLLAYL
jgi:S-formylglutathione hydrolase